MNFFVTAKDFKKIRYEDMVFNYFKKYVLVFLFFCIELSIYPMQVGFDAETDKFKQAITLAWANNFAQEKDVTIIKEYIKKGADSNYKMHEMTLLGLAASGLNKDLVLFLLDHGADVNKINSYNSISLELVVARRFQNVDSVANFETIAALCDAGSLLVSSNNTLFNHLIHKVAPDKMLKEEIEVLITHAHSVLPQDDDRRLRETIMGAFLTFEKLSCFPKEIYFRILSKLPINYLYGINKKFYQELSDRKYNIFLTAVEGRIEYINKILSIKNNQEKISREIFEDKYGQSSHLDVEEIRALLDGSKLYRDMKEFKKSFSDDILLVPKNNLAYNMYRNAQALFEKK